MTRSAFLQNDSNLAMISARARLEYVYPPIVVGIAAAIVLIVEVAPVAAGDDELVDFELRMNALCPVKQISVERILCAEPYAG